MNIRRLLLGSAGLMVFATACNRTPETTSKTAQDNTLQPIDVKVVEARATSESGAIEIPATIESSRRALVRSRLASSVISVSHREGERVSAGAVLVQLDAEALAAGLVAAQASDLAATRDLARAEALLAKGAATRNEVENATTAVARARSAMISARDAVSHATIRAPFTGKIVRKMASAGDSVYPGTPLLEIEGDGGLEVAASVEGSIRERLAIGQELDVHIDGVPDPVQGVVRALEPSADPSTHRFEVRAHVRGAVGVRAGLFARIRIPSPGTDRRILVPAGAILHRGGLTGVYVIRDGRAWLRWIAPGDSFGDSLEARAGLEDQERVALEPSRLHDGAVVHEVQ